MFEKSGWIGLGLVACSFGVQAEDMQIIVKYKMYVYFFIFNY